MKSEKNSWKVKVWISKPHSQLNITIFSSRIEVSETLYCCWIHHDPLYYCLTSTMESSPGKFTVKPLDNPDVDVFDAMDPCKDASASGSIASLLGDGLSAMAFAKVSVIATTSIQTTLRIENQSQLWQERKRKSSWGSRWKYCCSSYLLNAVAQNVSSTGEQRIGGPGTKGKVLLL